MHILPNALTPLVTLFPFLLMGAISSLAALDFLFAWWLVLFPAAALFVVMLLMVLVGEGLRDAFDPCQDKE